MAPLRRFASLLLFGGERRSGPRAQPKAWRRLFHLGAGSSIPIIAIFLAEDLLVVGLAVVAAGALAVDLARFRLEWLNRRYLRWFAPLLKADESGHITGATYMIISALIVFLLYGKEVGAPVMFFLSLGDPAAAVVGRRAPGPRLMGKSPAGTAAFVAAGAVALVALMLAGVIEHHWALWAGVCIAALVELASLPPDDNFTIPLAAGTAMHFLGV